jgi:NAD(P)-dependent dehydrogenase (short-subunit alcohol dehydrogenase family)
MVAGHLAGKSVLVLGAGDGAQRAVAVALALAGADVAIGGEAEDLAAEAALHSIANEIWALGRRSAVVKLVDGDAGAAARLAAAELGSMDLLVRCETLTG